MRPAVSSKRRFYLSLGALIGPMVIAGVTIDKRDEKRLLQIGVKDSKQLTPKKRRQLYREIEKLARSIIVLRVQPCQIDSYRARKISLDRLEAMKMAQIIDMCECKHVYLDALTMRPKKFGRLVLSYLQNKDKAVKLIAENFADSTYPVVAAASIIAKVERDKAVKGIERRVGEPVGVGYPHDPSTVAFVEKLIKQGPLPPFVRKSWITTQMLQEKNWQRKLKDFIFRKREECKGGKG